MTNRERLIKLLEYLYRNTDDEHAIGTNELTEHILGENTQAKRKTIKADIDSLENVAELDIICQKGSPDKYNWGNRLFDVAELKFLIDCVSASGILTENMSSKIIAKLQSLASIHQNEKLTSQLYIPKQLKTDNQQIFYSIDKLTDAINQNKKVTFQYWRYRVNKEKELLYNGEYFVCSPYGLAFDHGRYYLIGHSGYLDQITSYRVDRIKNLQILEEASEIRPEGFDIEEYLSGAFRMHIGEHTTVVLECYNEKMNTIIDHFGQDIEIQPVDGEHFRVEVNVKTFNTFYAWIFQMQGDIRIVGPEHIKEEYRQKIMKATDSL